MTIPRYFPKKGVITFCKNSCKKWVIGFEKGKGGYEHYQVRLSTSLSFEGLKTVFPKAHIEKCTDTWNYEKKEGHYICWNDTREIQTARFGRLRENQRRIVRSCIRQSNRSITVVYDPCGGSGKSWLARNLYERGKAQYVPPYLNSVKDIIQFVASGYGEEGIICIDLPRSWKWSKELYTGIEAIKDGLVFDGRYSARTRDIYGVKVLVFTNNKPSLDALSADRWDLLDREGRPIS